MSTPRGAPGEDLRTSGRRYPHLRDLQAWASQELAQYTEYTSVDSLLDRAQKCNQQVQTDVSFRRPDRAYVEWIKSERFLKLVGRHSEFPYLSPQKRDKYNSRLKEHESQRTMFNDIQKTIQDNNEENDTQFTTNGSTNVAPLSSKPGISRPLSMPKSPDRQSSAYPRPLSHTSTSSLSSQPGSVSSQSSPQTNGTSRAHVDPLLARFSQLRTSTSPTSKLPYPTNGDALKFPSGGAPKPNGNLEYPRFTGSPLITREARPLGPRGMPNAPQGPPLPPKKPIDLLGGPVLPPKKPPNPTVTTSFPRPPSPVYSPARNIGAPADIVPPRSSARSTSTTSYRPPQPVSQNYQLPPQNYTAKPTIANTMPRASQRPPLPNRTSITVEELHAFQRNGYSLVLVDARPRKLFDEGHINFPSVVCIDPFDLQWGDSFDYLLENLPYTPYGELELLKSIHNYDLVVVYDDDVASDSFLKGSHRSCTVPHLRTLWDTLTEYNHTNPLKRIPAILIGGLNEWVDVFGTHSLKQSDTDDIPQEYRLPKLGPRPASSTAPRDIREFVKPKPKPPFVERQDRPNNANANVALREAAERASKTTDDFKDRQEFHKTYDHYFRNRQDPKESMVSNAPTRRPPDPINHMPTFPTPTLTRTSSHGVSEPSYNTNTWREQPAAPPSLGPRYGAQLRSHRTGLHNPRFQCYMLGAIQCLSAKLSLSQYFLSGQFSQHVQRLDIMDIAAPYAKLLSDMWAENPDKSLPDDFRLNCVRVMSRQLGSPWDNEDQQDGQEFFSWMVERLHYALNIRSGRSEPVSSEADRNRLESLPVQLGSQNSWDLFSQNNYSAISECFTGQKAVRYRCTLCGRYRMQYATFNTQQLSIHGFGRSCTLHQTLRNMVAPEHMDDPTECPHCKERAPTTREERFTRMPNILVFQFTRFVSASAKDSTIVNFPLQDLDMGPYRWSEAQQSPQVRELDRPVNGPFIYNAYAILRHHGDTLSRGHYTAITKDHQGRWREFNDDDVNDRVERDFLGDAEPYLVFYERGRAR